MNAVERINYKGKRQRHKETILTYKRKRQKNGSSEDQPGISRGYAGDTLWSRRGAE